MEPINTFTSRTVVMPMPNIDTDQIIPARFLTTTTQNGLGQHCFADWRRRPDGSLDSEFPLNKPENAGAGVIVAGKNFGCGSSREHAPWALRDSGIRAVVSTQIADIFRANAARNGLVPIVVDEASHRWLIDHPGIELTVSVEHRTVSAESGFIASFPLNPFVRHCLLQGVDEMGYVMTQLSAITTYEATHQ